MAAFEKNITGVYPDTSLRLASITPDQHMNVIIKRGGTLLAHQENITLSHDGARELRDALIEAYPLPSASDTFGMSDKQYLFVPFGEQYQVVRQELVTRDTHVATVPYEEDARKITAALNEAEGL